MNKLLLLFFFIIELTHLIVVAQEPQRITGSAFPLSTNPDTVYIIYDQNFSEEELLIIQTIQGILSKSKPSIYRDVGTGSSVWLNDLIEKKLIIPLYLYEENFIGLLSHFKEKINGYVICDLHSTSSNIAISISGILNTIPVTEQNIELMDSLGIPQLYDLRNKNYNWVIDNFLDNFNKKIIIYQDTVKDLCLGDYSVFTNSLHFFDDIHSEIVDTIFHKMQKNSFLLGWGDDEYQTVHKSSNHSISVLPADYAYNLSLLTNLNSPIYQKNHEIETNTIDSVHTVCFVMSDGDNIQWLLNWFITDNRWFGNNNRGQIDIGWTISPALSELAPTAMNKIYENASDTENGKDYFIAGPSGTGYIYPETFEYLEEYTSQLNKYMQKSDLSIVNIIGNCFDDFYLYSFLEKENIKGLFYYDFSNYSSHNGEIRFINNKPIISARDNLWGGFNNTNTLSEKINNLPKDPYSSSGYSLIPVHNWSNSVDSILLCSQMFTDKIRVVSPDKFINLITENLSDNRNEIPFISYPNPTNSIFNIEFRENYKNIQSVELYNIGGLKQQTTNTNIESIAEKLSKIQIDVSQLKIGIYFLKIELTNNQIIIDKVIKQ